MTELGANLSIRLAEDGFVLAGEIDAHTAPQLERTLTAHIAEHQSAHLDVSGVTFMDSSGLRVLIGATNESRTRGGDLTLKSPTAVVRRLIEISGLAEHLRVTGTN